MAIMSEPAVQQPMQDVAAAQDNNKTAVDDSQLSTAPNNGTESRRRGSADGFRALADRLKKANGAPVATAAPAPVLPEVQPHPVDQPETVSGGIVAEQPVEQLQLTHADVEVPPSDGLQEIVEPQIEIPQVDAIQANYLANADEVPQVDAPVAQTEGPYENFLAHAEQPVPDYVVPPVEQSQATPPAELDAQVDLAQPPEIQTPDGAKEELNYTVSSPAGNPGTMDEILGSDLPNIQEPTPEPLIEEAANPEAGMVSGDPVAEAAQAPRQVYQGPVSFDPAALSVAEDAASKAATDQPAADTIDQGISTEAPATIETELVDQTVEAPVAPLTDTPVVEAPVSPVEPTDLAANAVPEALDLENVPDLSAILPTVEAEPQEPVEQPQVLTGGSSNELISEQAPVELLVDTPCAAQVVVDQSIGGNNLPETQLDQAQEETSIESTEEVAAVAETEPPNIVEQGLFDSALDEFKETNLSVEHLLAEITGEPIPTPAQVVNESTADDQEPAEGIDQSDNPAESASPEELKTESQPGEVEPTVPAEAIEAEQELEVETAETLDLVSEDTAEDTPIEQADTAQEDQPDTPVVEQSETESEEQPEAVAVEQTNAEREDQSETSIDAQADAALEEQPEIPVAEKADTAPEEQHEDTTAEQADAAAEEQHEDATADQADVVPEVQPEASTDEQADAAAEDKGETAVSEQTDVETEDQPAGSAESKDVAAVESDEANADEFLAESNLEAEPKFLVKSEAETSASKTDEPEPKAKAEEDQSSNWPTAAAKTQEDEFAPEKIDPQAGETARMLLDIMSKPSGAAQPQERALAADTLLRLVPKIPVVNLITLAERICMMEQPPALLVNKMLKHPRPDVAGPLLEGCVGISDQVLMQVIASGDIDKQKMIARRRSLTPTMCDELLEHGDASVYLTIVRNPGASISHDAFRRLSDFAKDQAALQAPLVTRGDTPAPVAFELFWFLPSELRRYVLSRFLTDSETLDKILKITLAVDGSENPEGEQTETKFADPARMAEFVTLIEQGEIETGTKLLSELAGINTVNAGRIINDSEGEPITVAMKAIGFARTEYSKVVEKWRNSNSILSESHRPTTELQNLFDSLSFNKARMLLTYWDWAADSSGPYALKAA